MSLGLLVNNKDIWESFVEELQRQREVEGRSLVQAEDMKEVYRAQGAIRRIDHLLKMRNVFNAKS